MKNWREAIRDGAVSGSVASILSTAVLAALSHREAPSTWSATNAISHWVWDKPAYREHRLDWSHTALGYGIHHASSMLWSTVFERWFGDRAERGQVARALAGGLAVAGLACFVDYRLTPERLQPGVEKHLSTPSMVAFYAAFGLALAVTGVVRARRTR